MPCANAPTARGAILAPTARTSGAAARSSTPSGSWSPRASVPRVPRARIRQDASRLVSGWSASALPLFRYFLSPTASRASAALA
jgi:hypothetical protein